jgi:hypothetical protein
MNEGIVSTRLGLRGWPNAAEDLIVARNVILSDTPEPTSTCSTFVVRLGRR